MYTHKFFCFLSISSSHDFIGEFTTSYRELSRGQSQFNVYEVKYKPCKESWSTNLKSIPHFLHHFILVEDNKISNNISSSFTVLYIELVLWNNISCIMNSSTHLRPIYYRHPPTAAQTCTEWLHIAQTNLFKKQFPVSCLVVKVLNPKKKGKKKKYVNSGTVRPVVCLCVFHQQLSDVSWTWLIVAVAVRAVNGYVCHEPPCDHLSLSPLLYFFPFFPLLYFFVLSPSSRWPCCLSKWNQNTRLLTSSEEGKSSVCNVLQCRLRP